VSHGGWTSRPRSWRSRASRSGASRGGPAGPKPRRTVRRPRGRRGGRRWGGIGLRGGRDGWASRISGAAMNVPRRTPPGPGAGVRSRAGSDRTRPHADSDAPRHPRNFTRAARHDACLDAAACSPRTGTPFPSTRAREAPTTLPAARNRRRSISPSPSDSRPSSRAGSRSTPPSPFRRTIGSGSSGFAVTLPDRPSPASGSPGSTTAACSTGSSAAGATARSCSPACRSTDNPRHCAHDRPDSAALSERRDRLCDGESRTSPPSSSRRGFQGISLPPGYGWRNSRFPGVGHAGADRPDAARIAPGKVHRGPVGPTCDRA